MKVLVVEDEALLSKQLAAALDEAGYAVDCAADGERADFLSAPSTTTPSCSTSGCRRSTA